MKSINLKALFPHLIAIFAIIMSAFLYCSPVLEGKTLVQSDIIKHKAQSKEIADYREKGEDILWTSRVFSGMTTFNIGANFKTNIMMLIKSPTHLFPQGVGLIILTCFGFYILLILMGVSPWLALIAAIAYGLSSNLLSSLNAGHNTKIQSIAFMAPAIGGVALAFRGRLIIGSIMTALFVGLMVSANHFQIVYYFLLVCVLGGIVYLIYALREKTLNQYLKTVGFLIAAGIIGFLPNFSKAYNVYEHNHDTIRGGKKLISSKSKKEEGGLDKSYAMSWSYGLMESFSVIVPSVKGGSSAEDLPANGAVAELVGPNRGDQPLKGPTYIGDQPFLQGVVYFGAAFIFLFFLSLFLVEDKIRVWFISIIVLSFFIAWGRHFSIFTDLLFNYFPLFNKFRTPSMALAMAGIAVPALAMIGLAKALSKDLDPDKFKRAFRLTLYTTGGVMTILLLYGLTNDWMGPNDVNLQSKAPWNNPQLFEALVADRKSLYMRDWMISLVIMAICGGLIWIYQKGKLSMTIVLVVLAAVTIGDTWRVSKRYLNNDSFVAERQYDGQFAMSGADKAILQDKDPHYRVINLTGNPWTDGLTCYYHKNIGGHHAAKIQRYQDLIENQLGSQIQLINKGVLQGPQGLVFNPEVSRQMTVYNMLNTKYFIVKKNAEGVIKNPTACGNAWFVENIKKVSTNDEEMDALSSINPLNTAIIHAEFETGLYNYNFGKSADAEIKLTYFAPDALTYTSSNTQDGLALFSEVIYPNGWKAYIDGEPAEIFRANYILRAIKIPAGERQIEMRFEPSTYGFGEGVSMAGSILFILFAGGMAFFLIKKNKSEDSTETT